MLNSQSNNFFTGIRNGLTANPDIPMLVFYSGTNRQEFTSGQIAEKIAAFQAYFTSLKIEKGQRVLVAVPVGLNLIAAILALMGMAAIPVIPPAKSSVIDLAKLYYKEKLAAVVMDYKKGGIVGFLSGLKLVKIGYLSDAATTAVEKLKNENVPAGQPALITFTSGSTGLPKAIIRSHSLLTEQHLAIKSAFPPAPQQRDFPLFPNILLHNLSAGIRSVLPDISSGRLNEVKADIILDQIEREKINTLTGNVFYFEKLICRLKESDKKYCGVNAIGIGGSPVPEWLYSRLQKFFPNAALYCIYGTSEAEPIAVRRFENEGYPPNLGYCVGTVHPGITIKIDGSTPEILQTGYISGEILVQGKHVAVPHGKKYLPTGDLGYIDKNNRLFLTGRKGNDKICNGVQHYQVEHVLAHVEGVEKAACIPEKEGFNIYISGSAGRNLIDQKIQEAFEDRLMYKIFYRTFIPVDNRHLSKIIYHKIA